MNYKHVRVIVIGGAGFIISNAPGCLLNRRVAEMPIRLPFARILYLMRKAVSETSQQCFIESFWELSWEKLICAFRGLPEEFRVMGNKKQARSQQ